MESSYSLGGTVTAEAMMENSMNLPWNIKHRGIRWSCNPIPGLRSRENHHSKLHVHLDFQGSTIYNSPNIKPTKMSTDTNMKTTSYICTLKYYSASRQNEIIILAAAWMNQEIIILCEVSQRQKGKHLKISCTVRIYKFIPMNCKTETAWENQILIIKRKLEGRDKLRI